MEEIVCWLRERENFSSRPDYAFLSGHLMLCVTLSVTNHEEWPPRPNFGLFGILSGWFLRALLRLPSITYQKSAA